jgi:hypothetical protein
MEMSGHPAAFICMETALHILSCEETAERLCRKATLMQDFPSIIKPDWKDAREYEKVTTMTRVKGRNKASQVDSVYRYFQINLPQVMVHAMTKLQAMKA